MANTFKSNTVYIDTTGSTNLPQKRVKVAYIIFNSAATNDLVTLRDGGSGDPIKLYAIAPAGSTTQFFDFSASPIVFNDAIYCSALTSGATALLYLTSEGSTV